MSQQVDRRTKETDIRVLFSLDGGEIDIKTGIGFLDHMLTSLAFHAGFGLTLTAEGDLHVDGHHTAEDIGITLGQAFRQAIGQRQGICRFADVFIPMDEALSFAAVDISGRPFLHFDAVMPQEKIGDFDSCLTEEFMRAFAFNAGITLHLKTHYGTNAHHITESLFKALARALRNAVKIEGDITPSTKGVL